ncbi:apolipoprotein A-IV-like [Solea senegalensis]|uniref:Apolipoprotein A-IV n=1 Tax=Solea senegalensis TaxID=28829 RepID=A0AAV6R611_SOLSE|nr:apolipoprotein A-IV-like [Solea senegalensis]KAG7500861.1 apolipoprotein A-IV-like [Solea senegalensis]
MSIKVQGRTHTLTLGHRLNSELRVMKILVVLVLAVFTGCNARAVKQQQPKQQIDMVRDAFWDYVGKATSTAEDSLKQIRQSELGKEVNTLISESTNAVNHFSDAMRTQVAPLTKDLMSKLSKEAQRLQLRLQKDLTTMGTNLQPYAEELASDLQKKVEDLRSEAVPYANAMDSDALRAILLQRSQELKLQLEKTVKELQGQVVPYTEEMKEKMEESVEEFQRSMIPMTQNFQSQLSQKTQEIQKNLAPLGEELRAKLDGDAQNLKKQLTTLWQSFTKMMQ